MKKMHLSLINNLKYMISIIFGAYGILDVLLGTGENRQKVSSENRHF